MIDANIYWLPAQLFQNKDMTEEFIRCIPKGYDVAAIAERLEDGQMAIRIEKPLGYENLNYFENDYFLEKQLSDMDAAGIEKAVLKLPGCQEWLSLELCQKFNDAAAVHAAKSGGRMAALAVVPPYGDAACLKELDRCIDEWGMKGVQMSAHYGNHYLDDMIFRPMFAHINERHLPVYVHHTPIPVDSSSLLDYNNLRRSYGRCEDQIIAISRELFSKMFEELPNLKLIHSMLGGGFFAYTSLFFPTDSGHGRFRTDNEKITNWLKNNIYFELSHAQPWGKAQLELAVNVLGADHIIYGSSYPVKTVWMTGGPSFILNLDITDEQKQLILKDNARKIYRIQ